MQSQAILFPFFPAGLRSPRKVDVVQRSDALQRGVLSLPDGYGMDHPPVAGGPRVLTGPRINELTCADHCDPRTKTPFHKGVPVRLDVL